MASTKEFKCLNCKAGLNFNPPTQKWVCDYCYSEFVKEDLEDNSQDDNQLTDDVSDLDLYNCNSCGAQIITDTTTSATFCLYCKNPTIIKNRFSGVFKPKYVIPFKITSDEAKRKYKSWIRKKIFAPKEFKTKDEIDKVTGIYVPFWLFNSYVYGSIDGQARRVHSSTRGDYKYTTTKYYQVLRRGNTKYINVPVDGSKKLDDKMMQMIEPFEYKDLTEFSMQYMSGFMADKYDVDVDEASVVMNQRINEFFEKRLRDTINGYSSVAVNSRNINLSDISQHYAMLPIFLLTNSYKEKKYLFMINGQTGKIVGDTPLSLKKQILFTSIIFISVCILAILGGALIV